jgi:two-component system cell cycle sensor histidine kinase/response regulator CckA
MTIDVAPRILVVDDDASVSEFVARTLQTAGYDVVVAADGWEALEVTERRGPFDGFVVDFSMPGMSGSELALKITRIEPDARILYFTGFADRLFNEKTTLWQHEAFVEKPLTMKGLLEAVSLLLHGDLCDVDKARRPERAS